MFFRNRQVAGNDNLEPPPGQTVIGRDTRIEGIIDSTGEVFVEGTLTGSLRARTCIVGPDGLVEGDVSAEEVTISGQVNGPVKGRHVHLRAGSRVDGDIVNQTISVDSGAELNGAVWRSDDPLGQSRAPSTPHLPAPESGSLFSNSLWDNRGSEEFRPLHAIRPKR